jgi:hypothetical protein
MLEIPKGRNRKEKLDQFVDYLTKIQDQIGFKVSARGWCYQLEQFGLINKGQFNSIESLINKCRKEGYLPIDFVATEESRQFSGVEEPNTVSPIGFMKLYLEAALDCGSYYIPDWWDGEEYYIQMIVEKVDLVTLFKPICKEYHIAIASTKGWSSMLQRAEYAKRFQEAEEMNLKCVLLYCGDHDPDGLRISDFLRKNLFDLTDIYWEDGTDGYDPTDLTIERFGLDLGFILDNNLTWIENLITGSGKNLASPTHKNFHMEYVQNYLREIGIRKCEANALVVRPEQGRELCRDTIEKYIGSDSLDRFKNKREKVKKILKEFRESTGLDKSIKKAIEIINKKEGLD